MDGKSLEEILKSNLEKRKLCDARGFHRIEKEPETENSAIVCYDCYLGFDKRTALHLGIKYIIEPNKKIILEH